MSRPRVHVRKHFGRWYVFVDGGRRGDYRTWAEAYAAAAQSAKWLGRRR